MAFFRRLALHRFVKTHPPSREVAPASGELIATYKDVLPESLLELWRRKGLGFYGDLQIALIDPRLWQHVLDQWIISPPDTALRVPIAVTSFGTLLYYRKLTPEDEDVAYIDPTTRETGDLAWSLDDFFNDVLCEQETLEDVLEPALAQAAQQECGVLAPGEVYEVDQMLLSMQMLRTTKVDALDMHHRLRQNIEPSKPKASQPKTVFDALPKEHRAALEGIPEEHGLTGLYLSSYIDWYRLLALKPDGQYQLLFWKIHNKTFERTEIRAYSGPYEVSISSDGDEIIELNIVIREDSLGSDARDEQLIVINSDEETFLLRTEELDSVATAICDRNLMGKSEYYFRKVTFEETFIKEPYEGRAVPHSAKLPNALQALISEQRV